MELDKQTVQHYLSVVGHKIDNLLNKVEAVGQKDFDSSSPIVLSEILVRILSRFADDLKTKYQNIDDFPFEDTLRKIQTINLAIVRIIPPLVEAVETAAFTSNTIAVVQAYEDVVNKVKFGSKVLIHPTWEYNAEFYEIIYVLEWMTSELGAEINQAIFSGAPPSFGIITFPKADEDIVLRQALIAHELGHFIDKTLEWSKEILDRKIFLPEDFEKLNDAVYSSIEISDKKKEILLQEVVYSVEEVITPWVKEVIADFIAIWILGPAYLFAFDEVSFSPQYSSGKKISKTHPPNELRKMFMSDVLMRKLIAPIKLTAEYQNLTDEQRNLFNCIEDWINYHNKNLSYSFNNFSGDQALSKELVNTAFNILSGALKRTVKLLEDEFLPAEKDKAWIIKANDIIDAILLQRLLANGLTPTELTQGRLPTLAAVMNCGWFTLLFDEEKYAYFGHSTVYLSGGVKFKEYLVLQNLVSKALENLQFQREFIRRKGGAQ